MDEESTLILLNNTFSALNSREARQLPVKPIGSKWVYKTEYNPDKSTRYKARLVIKGDKQMDFGETYAPVGKRTTFRYLISLIGRYGWNMDHLDVVTAFLNPEIDKREIAGRQVLPTEVRACAHCGLPKAVRPPRRRQMLVVWRDCGPDAGAPLPPLQQMERPAENSLENSGTDNRLESGQMLARADL